MSEPKKLLNSPDTAVVEALEGLVDSSPELHLLDGLPDIKVVVRAGAKDENRVAVIAGGGAGHEPAMAGYVGEGMLAAAVSGDIFASPSAQAVASAIRTVTGSSGCLLICMNYTGDRLHFGLAAEQCKAEGLQVEMLVTADDCALPSKSLVGRRGIAGTALVLKVAGATAAAGRSLLDVKAEAEAASKQIGTVGMAVEIGCMPGAPVKDRLGPEEMELGLGIHGEPGAERVKLPPVDTLVPKMLDRIRDYPDGPDLRAGRAVVVMVNNMGGTPPMELYVVARAACKYAREHLKVKVARLLVGTFMTSLNMAGASITLWPASQRQLELLDAPAKAPGWPGCAAAAAQNKARLPVPAGGSAGAASQRPQELSGQGRRTAAAIASAADALIRAWQQLDDWDRQVGDGDCGSTLRRGAETIKADMAARYPLNSLAETAEALGGSVSSGMGGSSGALYHIFFAAAAGMLKEQAASPDLLARAFKAGADAISTYGGARPGDRTMLDALQPAAEALQQRSSSGSGAAASLAKAAAEAAQQGADSTRGMKASAGRSAYVPDQELRDVPDPGAQAVAIWLQAVAGSLR